MCASGCTGSAPENKTYSDNGVSFTYPGDWDVLDSSDFQSSLGEVGGTVLVVVGIQEEVYFVVAELVPGEDEYLRSPSEWLSYQKTRLGSDYISDKTITIDGVEGIQIKSNEEGFNNNYVYWKKKDNGHIAYMISKEESEDTFDSIVSTIETS